MKNEVIKEKFKLDSTLVEYVIYDYQKKELDVLYKKGKHKGNTRTYKHITEVELREIVESDHPGKRLLKTIAKKKGNSSGLWGYFTEKIKDVYS